MNIENIFSNFIYLDLILIIILTLIVYFWIHKKGLKDIILLIVNLYIVNLLISNLIIRSLGLGIIQDNLASLILYFIVIFFVFLISPLRKNLTIYSQKILVNLLFTIAFVGLIMVTVMQVINLDNYVIYSFLQNKIFVSKSLQVIWYIIPLISISLLQNKKFKK